MLAQPLAARDAAHVGIDHLDQIDVGIGPEEFLGLRPLRDPPDDFAIAPLLLQRLDAVGEAAYDQPVAIWSSPVTGLTNIIL